LELSRIKCPRVGVFCTRDRLCPIAGLYGRQPVMHGAQEVRVERFAVGIPFHDYLG
jgi:hypothetical protein